MHASNPASDSLGMQLLSCIVCDCHLLQGRAGEELAAELTKRLEQCLRATPSGRGAAASLLLGRTAHRGPWAAQSFLRTEPCLPHVDAGVCQENMHAGSDASACEGCCVTGSSRLDAGSESAVRGARQDVLGAVHRRPAAQRGRQHPGRAQHRCAGAGNCHTAALLLWALLAGRALGLHALWSPGAGEMPMAILCNRACAALNSADMHAVLADGGVHCARYEDGKGWCGPCMHR